MLRWQEAEMSSPSWHVVMPCKKKPLWHSGVHLAPDGIGGVQPPSLPCSGGRTSHDLGSQWAEAKSPRLHEVMPTSACPVSHAGEHDAPDGRGDAQSPRL